MTENPPDYELFTKNRGGPNAAWIRDFVLSLEPGVPVAVPPERLQGRKARNVQQMLSFAARSRGLPLATRTFGGTVWACVLTGDAAERLLARREQRIANSKNGAGE